MPQHSLATTQSDRRALRRTQIERRLALPATSVERWSEAICGHLQQAFVMSPGRQIAFCWPVRNEPDLRPLVARWCTEGALACLPVVVASAAPLAFRPWVPGAPMLTDRFGIPTPASGDFIVPDVVLLPLNAFDEAGYRVGYGGGFFDRTLATILPRPLAIGVGYEMAGVASVFPEPHDQRLDWIVTEAGMRAPR